MRKTRRLSGEEARIKRGQGDRPLATADPYIDTVGAFVERPLFGAQLKALRSSLGREYFYEPIERDDTLWGYILRIHQPTEAAIKLLARWSDEHSISIYRVDIAFDLDALADTNREDIRDYISSHARLRFCRRDDKRCEIEGTISWIECNERESPPSKNLVFYDDRHGKLDGELNKPHLELRLLRSRIVKNAGIFKAADLFDINPAELLAGHVAFASTEPYLLQAIRATLKDAKPNPYIDIERRVRAMWRRLGFHQFDEFARRMPRKAELLKKANPLQVSDRLQWVRYGRVG